MTHYKYESPYGVTVTDLFLAARPRVARVTFTHQDSVSEICFDNPRPLEALTTICDLLLQFRIVDRNDDGNHLEFGRYEVEICDEDGPVARFEVDGYRIDEGLNE